MTDLAHQPISVNFMIVGTQKGGTTALHAFLLGHPDICMARNKETHFFEHNEFFEDGQPLYGEYATAFPDYHGQMSVGEASPSYMFVPDVAPRLHQYNPALKLIFALRDPVERAFSHYSMAVKAGVESLPFAEALQAEEGRLAGAVDSDHGKIDLAGFAETFHIGERRLFEALTPKTRNRPRSPLKLYSYASRGFYMRQINNLLHYFPREQMLFLRQDELMNAHEASLRRIYAFLGVEPVIPAHKKIFSLNYKPMLPQDRTYLLDVFAEDTAELAKFTEWDLSDWRK